MRSRRRRAVDSIWGALGELGLYRAEMRRLRSDQPGIAAVALVVSQEMAGGARYPAELRRVLGLANRRSLDAAQALLCERGRARRRRDGRWEAVTDVEAATAPAA